MRTRPEEQKMPAIDGRAAHAQRVQFAPDSKDVLDIGDDVIEMILQSDSSPPVGQGNQPIRAHMILTPSSRSQVAETPFPYDPDSYNFTPFSPSLADMLDYSPEEPLKIKRERSPMPRMTGGEPEDVKRVNEASTDDKMRQRKALAARSSRQKHKEYVQTLQKENEELRARMEDAERRAAHAHQRMTRLEEDVQYLRRVIANDGAIGRVIRHLPNVEEISLSSSLDGEVMPQGGICLHLMNNRKVSLELCSACAANAENAAGPVMRVRNSGRSEQTRNAEGEEDGLQSSALRNGSS